MCRSVLDIRLSRTHNSRYGDGLSSPPFISEKPCASSSFPRYQLTLHIYLSQNHVDNINRIDYSSISVNQEQGLRSLQKLKQNHAQMLNLTGSAKVFHKTTPDLNIRNMKYVDPVHTKQDSNINRNTNMKYKESTITEHESTIKLSNNNSRIIYSSSNTREKPRNVKSNSDLNKYSRTVDGNNVLHQRSVNRMEGTEIYRDPALLRWRCVNLRTGGKTRLNSNQLGSRTRTRQTLTRSTQARNRQNSAPPSLHSPEEALLSPQEALKELSGEKENKRGSEDFRSGTRRARAPFIDRRKP